MTQLKQITSGAERLIDTPVKDLHKLFPEPTLFHLPGKIEAPLFCSVLLHGNETTGYLALQQFLKKYLSSELPRSFSFFLGNTEAASMGMRRLENQPDFNRIWPGTEQPLTQESAICAEIVKVMQEKSVFASIDIHNNTGLNPHYACTNRLEDRYLNLARQFSRLIVYFTRPKGVQSLAFADICPAVTLECGKPGQKYGVKHALSYLETCIHITDLNHSIDKYKDLDIFHTVAQIKINPDIEFSFSQADSDMLLDTELEQLNFSEIPAGTVFANLGTNTPWPAITVKDDQGRIVTDSYFSIQNGQMVLNKKTMPSMLTTNEAVIRQDCLCYLMERLKP